jgi:hypothetical protein
MGNSGTVGAEAFVVAQLWCADHRSEPDELAVVAAGHSEQTVTTAQGLVWSDGGVAVAHALGCLTCLEVALGLVDERAQQAGEQIDLHSAPVPGLSARSQCGEHPDGGVLAAQNVHQCDTGFGRLALRFAGDAHEPAHRLHHEVVPEQFGACGGAETGDRAVDDARVDGLDLFVAQTETFQRSGAVVLHEHVCARGQLQGKCAIGRCSQIEGDTELGAVDALEVRRAARGPGRAPGAGVVAGAWSFDLDHGGPEVGKVHGAQRPGKHTAEVRDQDAVKGAGHHDPAVGGRLWPSAFS